MLLWELGLTIARALCAVLMVLGGGGGEGGMADNVGVTKQRLQGLAKGEVGRSASAEVLCGTIGRDLVDCYCCQELHNAKGIQRDQERIQDIRATES